MGAEAQIRFIPSHEGQPSRREAWHDAGVNRAWGDFYAQTADTLENAYVRPRFNGYIKFQTEASALLRQAFDEGRDAASVVQLLNANYRTYLEKAQ
jgi:multiple sugar transport system substrate-binding protein